ncbi:MAG: hypothetical protein SVX38_16865, partial [Chloroflexota bacterium]|nr:hypothetical protein [Chloroflexota bacterium]
MSRAERVKAERLSVEVDRLLRGEETAGGEGELWPMVERLAVVNSLFEPPDAAFRQRTWARVLRSQPIPRRWRRQAWPRAWTTVALTLVLAVAVIGASPRGRQAIAEVMGIFRLG